MHKRFYFLAIYVAFLHIILLGNLLGLVPGGRTYAIVDSATVIPLGMTLLLLRKRVKCRELTRLDFAIGLYGALSILSLVCYLLPENPSAPLAYLYGIHYFVLPMSMYFAAKSLSPDEQRRLLLLVCYLNLFALAFGIYLYYARPEFYRSALIERIFLEKAYGEEYQIFARLQSYLGSTAVGTVATATLVLLFICRAPGASVAISLPIALVAVALSQQRGGLVTCLGAATYLLWKARLSPLVKGLVLPAGILLGVVVIRAFDTQYYQQGLLENSLDKFSLGSIIGALGEYGGRGYGSVVPYFNRFPFGVGLGATSSAAYSAGLASMGQVVDANFMRILADLGIQGLCSFLAILVIAFLEASKKREGSGWIVLLSGIVLICLGTNTLDSQYVSHLFWMFLGVIDTPDWSEPMIGKQKSASRLVTL